MKFIKSIYAIIISSAVLPLTALAEFGYPIGGIGINPLTTGGFGGADYRTRSLGITTFESLLALAQRLIGYFQVIIFVVAIIMALYGALLIVAKGNFEAGRGFLLYAFVGIIIAILAFSIIPIACYLTGANNSPACFIGSY